MALEAKTMFITTSKTIDMETGITLFLRGYTRDGWDGVWLAKGDPTAKAAEQQQMQFDQQLMSLFQAQYGKQSAITSFLTGKMEPLISKGGQGYTPEQLAAMRTSATDTISQQTQNAQRAINATQERGLPSGVNAQVQGSLMAQEAEQQAATQNQITQANANLQQENYWNAINVLNGQAATENPLGYAGGATNGSGAVAGLSEADTQRRNSGFLHSLATGLGTGIAGGLTSAIFGG